MTIVIQNLSENDNVYIYYEYYRKRGFTSRESVILSFLRMHMRKGQETEANLAGYVDTKNFEEIYNHRNISI